MRYFCLACDYDGTLASEGKVHANTLAALESVVASGRKLIVVTGRELDDFLSVFPEANICERIVAENGALLYRPRNREIQPLASPPPAEFIAALRRHRVEPLSVGRSIVATQQPNEATVLSVIRQLGLELQVVFNKGAVMVLPSGVNKGTGLMAALEDLGLSRHNTVAVGDAENDHALLSTCECGVAVANSIPTLKQRAELVTSAPNGKGVEELVEKLVSDDLQEAEPKLTRHRILLGTSVDGQEIHLGAYGSGLAIAGPSASGKSSIVHAILEQLIEEEYQACLIDPEGDYAQYERIVSLGSADRVPTAAEIVHLLQKPKNSAGVNLIGMPLDARPAFCAALLLRIQELRAKTGRPHWLMIDEAHHLLPASFDSDGLARPLQFGGLILVTVHVNMLSRTALEHIHGIIAVGPSREQTLEEFSRAKGLSPPKIPTSEPQRGEVLVWFPGQTRKPFPVIVRPASAEFRRHQRNYAEGRLGLDKNFFFRGPEGKLNLRAQNLVTFIQLAEGVDESTWLHHLRNGDYSRWFREVIKDQGLATEAAEIESSPELSPAESRARVIQAINKRYTAPA